MLFGLPVSPAGEVLSSPQVPVQDNETKAGIFPGKVIIVDHGKLVRIYPHPITPDYLLAVPPKRGTTNRRLVWILTG